MCYYTSMTKPKYRYSVKSETLSTIGDLLFRYCYKVWRDDKPGYIVAWGYAPFKWLANVEVRWAVYRARHPHPFKWATPKQYVKRGQL